MAELDVEARDKALAALASGASVSEAARVSKYSRIHIHRLLKDPRFLEELERRKEALAKVPTSEDEKLALDTLRELAESAEEERDRIAAAKALLAHVKEAKRAAKPGPQAAPANTPPPIKLLEGQGAQAADEWLKAQG